jgi:tripartite-type tricarboxylate transporter receptor subunit TctC
VQRLNEEIAQVLKDPQVAAKLLNAGMVAASSSPDAFAAIIRKDADKMATLFRGKPKK